MGDKTKIQWTDATWNPVTGCTKVSAGCKHCYAERDWARLSANHKTRYYGREFTDVQCHDDVLELPLRWSKPRNVFVNSMSDLFHPDVPDEFIDHVFGVMWACLYLGKNAHHGHVFQVLTKRAERMRDYMQQNRREQWARAAVNEGGGIDPDRIWDQVMDAEGPHPRIWLGVSVEDQATADERIPLLLDTPAAKRFLSIEPLLGPIKLPFERIGHWNALAVQSNQPWATTRLHWVIVGGESGPHARPMHPEWVRSLRDQCAEAGVPFFFKQWGEWGPDCIAPVRDSHRWPITAGEPDGGVWSYHIGKKAAGCMLDGREWKEVPEK